MSLFGKPVTLQSVLLDSIGALIEMRIELERMKAERDMLREQIERTAKGNPMTTDTLLTEAADWLDELSALAERKGLSSGSGRTLARQLREREAKAEGLDAAFRKGLEAGAQCCEAAHRTSAYGDAAEPLEIARYIRKQADELSRQYAAILATKPGDGESR